MILFLVALSLAAAGTTALREGGMPKGTATCMRYPGRGSSTRRRRAKRSPATPHRNPVPKGRTIAFPEATARPWRHKAPVDAPSFHRPGSCPHPLMAALKDGRRSLSSLDGGKSSSSESIHGSSDPSTAPLHRINH